MESGGEGAAVRGGPPGVQPRGREGASQTPLQAPRCAPPPPSEGELSHLLLPLTPMPSGQPDPPSPRAQDALTLLAPPQAPFLQRHLDTPVSLTQNLRSYLPSLCFPCTPSGPRPHHFSPQNVSCHFGRVREGTAQTSPAHAPHACLT